MKRFTALILCSTGLMALVACLETIPKPSPPPAGNARYPDTVAALDRETDCPHTWFEEDLDLKERVRRVTGGLEDVPELGDCQRFVTGTRSAPRYDPGVFAIFVSRDLDTLSMGTAALIYAKDGEYDHLGIETGFNCLVMAEEPRTGWTAAMIPVRDRPEDCSRAAPDQTNEKLRVIEDPNPAVVGNVPAAARWAFNDAPWEAGRNPHQYIVIKCGATQCFVGTDALPKPPSLLGERQESREASVLGLNDRQYLAERPLPGGSVRTPVQPALEGFLLPDADLATATHSRFEETWVPVADVYLGARNPAYLAKANFDGPPGSLVKPTRVFTCIDKNSSSCPGMNKEWMNWACQDLDRRSGKKYRSMHLRFRRGGPAMVTDTLFRCVQYYRLSDELLSSGFQIPGSVRWRWLSEDETLWHRCADGCCKVD